MRFIFTSLLSLMFVIGLQSYVHANTYLEGIITNENENTFTVDTGNNKIIEIQKDQVEKRQVDYKTGDRVVLTEIDTGQEKLHFITDYIRRPELLILGIIFTLLSIVIGKKYGLFSIVGMFISFVVIFTVIIPGIASGRNPILMTLLGSIVIIPATFYLSHGFNKKTNIAMLGTFISLVITSVLATIFVNISKLSGLASEEAVYLGEMTTDLNMKGILLASIIIGFLGILDDITVSQAGIIYQLKKANSKLNTIELYKRGMELGRDHITSMINTLVLVYAGASMPLLLLFTRSDRSLLAVLNIEMIAEEIVRTLVGSIGLMIAVPITTLIAAIAFDLED